MIICIFGKLFQPSTHLLKSKMLHQKSICELTWNMSIFSIDRAVKCWKKQCRYHNFEQAQQTNRVEGKNNRTGIWIAKKNCRMNNFWTTEKTETSIKKSVKINNYWKRTVWTKQNRNDVEIAKYMHEKMYKQPNPDLFERASEIT